MAARTETAFTAAALCLLDAGEHNACSSPAYSAATSLLKATEPSCIPDEDAVERLVPADADLALRAAEILAFRRARDELLGEALFADPAWDILLDLFIRESRGQRATISQAVMASATPPTTGLRRLAGLVEAGLLTREVDPTHGRRKYVALAEEARIKLRHLLGMHADVSATNDKPASRVEQVRSDVDRIARALSTMAELLEREGFGDSQQPTLGSTYSNR